MDTQHLHANGQIDRCTFAFTRPAFLHMLIAVFFSHFSSLCSQWEPAALFQAAPPGVCENSRGRCCVEASHPEDSHGTTTRPSDQGKSSAAGSVGGDPEVCIVTRCSAPALPSMHTVAPVALAVRASVTGTSAWAERRDCEMAGATAGMCV
jgi:hypothetical protein